MTNEVNVQQSMIFEVVLANGKLQIKVMADQRGNTNIIPNSAFKRIEREIMKVRSVISRR